MVKPDSPRDHYDKSDYDRNRFLGFHELFPQSLLYENQSVPDVHAGQDLNHLIAEDADLDRFLPGRGLGSGFLEHVIAPLRIQPDLLPGTAITSDAMESVISARALIPGFIASESTASRGITALNTF